MAWHIQEHWTNNTQTVRCAIVYKETRVTSKQLEATLSPANINVRESTSRNTSNTMLCMTALQGESHCFAKKKNIAAQL